MCVSALELSGPTERVVDLLRSAHCCALLSDAGDAAQAQAHSPRSPSADADVLSCETAVDEAEATCLTGAGEVLVPFPQPAAAAAVLDANPVDEAVELRVTNAQQAVELLAAAATALTGNSTRSMCSACAFSVSL